MPPRFFIPEVFLATDNRTGESHFIFEWEKELVDSGFSIEPCTSTDFFYLNRARYCFVPSRLLDVEGFFMR